MLPSLTQLLQEWPWVAPLLVLVSVAMSATTVVFVLLDRRCRSQTAISWVLLVMVAPFVGPIIYWMFGKPWLSAKRERAYREVAAERAEAQRRQEVAGGGSARRKRREAVFAALTHEQRMIARQASTISGDFPVAGNDISILDEADQLFSSMEDDIERAERHVHVLFYIALDDETSCGVFRALERASRRGVCCRLLLDGLGSRSFLKSDRRAELEKAGVTVVEALPVGIVRRRFGRIDLRNHRKIVVIDGAIGYIGSHNLASKEFKVKEKFAPWIDATTRVSGPVANDLQRIFVEDWYLETDEELWDLLRQPSTDRVRPAVAQVLGTGPSTYESAMPQMVLSLVNLAEQEVVLTTPYFVPDEPALAALMTASRRGVRTVLIIPEKIDSRVVQMASQKFFQRLLDAGVEIWRFEGGLLHSKTIVADGKTSLMTSSNLDRRSFELNLEASMVIYDAEVSEKLRALQGRYLKQSRRISAGEWYRRPAWKRLRDNFFGLLSPLL